jgi:hypothetical protein
MAMMRWLRLIASGRELPPLLKAAFSSHLMTWVIMILAGFLGIWGSIASAQISADLGRFFRAFSQGAAVGGASDATIAFVVLAVLVWPILLYLRLVAVEVGQREQVRRIKGAIHRAPSRIVIDDYPDDFKKAAAVIDALVANDALNPPCDEKAIEEALRGVLHFVGRMADKFSHSPQQVRHSVNLMMVADPATLNGDQVATLESGLRFADRRLREYHRVLWLPVTLAVDEDGSRVPVPRIALPVPSEAESARGKKLALPGAPWALLTGRQSVYQDTRRLHEEWSDLHADVRAELLEYFSEGGAGELVRSFTSFHILSGVDETSAGVLNIDATDTCVLGPDPEFYGTFRALITPYLGLIAAPLVALTESILGGSDLFRTADRTGPEGLA